LGDAGLRYRSVLFISLFHFTLNVKALKVSILLDGNHCALFREAAETGRDPAQLLVLNLSSLPYIISVIQIKEDEISGVYSTHGGKIKKVHKILIFYPEGKRPLGEHKRSTCTKLYRRMGGV
jgi:hypothetical protein